MEQEHASWFNFLPFYKFFQEVAHANVEGFLFQSHPKIQHVFAAALVTLILLSISIRARMQLNKAGKDAVIPDPNLSIRNFLELLLEAVYKQSRVIIGPDAARYFPVIGTLALFILFSNLLGLVPGMVTPNDNWNTTITCGLFVFVYYNFHGLRVQGLGYLAHMANPAGTWWGWFMAPLMLPIEIASHCFRPITLGLRLAANMTADHAVLFAFLGLVPILVPLPFLALGMIVCVIQTLVFVLLTMVYIGLATADTHHDDEAHAH